MKGTVRGVAFSTLLGCTGLHAQIPSPVLQRGYDANVSGATLGETILNAANVNVNSFGLVMKLPVDDNVFAQPLYVPGVAIPNQGTHNVLYVATMSDTVYAFDADVGGAPLWSANLASLVGATPIPIANFTFLGNKNIIGNLGVLSTPVIDPSTQVMYVVAGTLEGGTMAYRLHALDIATGTEPYGPGVLIQGSYGGSTFDARYQTQRVSLALAGNQVIFAFGAVELEYSGGYVGWVMAYDKANLQQTGAFATITSGSRGGGVWQSGRPPVVDNSGNVYVFVGNGYSSGYNGTTDFNESVLKLNPANALQLVDWFTPGNWSHLDTSDLDLTSSGPLMIPGTTELAGGGKTGDLYVLESTNLGKFNANDSQVIQKENITANGEFRGGPVYWQRSTAQGGPVLFNWGAYDYARAYSFLGTKIAASPSSESPSTVIWPGGILALSANGGTSGSGVLWATVATSGDAENSPPVPGELHAFNAENLSQELWNSAQNASRDGYGNYAKFVPPLVANGRVYVATWSKQVAVYGLLGEHYTVSPSSLAFGNVTINVPSPAQTVIVTNTGGTTLPISSISLSGTSPHPFSETNTCGTSVAVGTNCTISVLFDSLSSGLKKQTLKVTAGSNATTTSIALSGTAVAAPFTVLPATISFGTVASHGTSAPATVTVTNTGSAALPIAGITLATGNPGQFKQSNTCGSSVAVGGTCTITVEFKPTSAGAKSTKLEVNAAAHGTLSVALSGTGS